MPEDDLFGLLSVRPTPRSAVTRLIDTRLSPDRLVALIRTAIRAATNNSAWFLGAAFSWLPETLLDGVVEVAVNDRMERENPSADEVIQLASLQRPAALTPHLRRLWATDPNRETYYRSWPWRGADDGEISRLMGLVTGAPSGSERARAAECLLQTRREDVLELVARLWDDELPRVGFGIENGVVRRLCAETPLHAFYPADTVEAWMRDRRLRTGNPTWVAPDDPKQVALIGGLGTVGCPQCGERSHRLLSLDQLPSLLGVTSRSKLDFVWCSWCSTYSNVTYLRFDGSGTPVSMTLDGFVNVGLREPIDPFIQTEVGLSSIGERWRLQDWASSNDRENLHRVGGEPTWIQDPTYPRCPDCGGVMVAIGQIAVEDLWSGEGITYLLWCDACAIGGVVYQQT